MSSLSIEQAMQVAQRFQDQGKLKDAEDVCRKILAASPGFLPILYRLGAVLGLSGKLDDALQIFQQAAQADPNSAVAWFNVAVTHEQLEQFDAAIDALRQATSLLPDVAEYWHRLGVCLGKNGDYGAAVESLRRAVQIDPLSRPSRQDLVLGLVCLGQLDAAIDAARKGFELEPENLDALIAMGCALRVAGNLDDAAEVWSRALQDHPDHAEIHGHWAMSLLTLGDFTRGWREYEWRWQCESFKTTKHRDVQKQWGTGQGVGHPDLNNRTLLLYAEQGIGDTIQFVRFASLLAERGARVIVECQWQLKLLLQTCPGVRLVYSQLDQLPAYDWHIPMMSLPFALGTTLATVPAKVPYLSPDPARCKSWRSRVQAATRPGTRLRVGLAWAGNADHKNDAHRSINPALLAPLGDVPGITFFSLQKKHKNKKAAQPPPGLNLVDFSLSLHDFSDTAALIEQLDLVISVDTAVPHLAGAMARPVWTLIPFVPDFRWMERRLDSPWYPTMRLFRQQVLGHWPEVIDRVKQELAQAASPKI